MVENNFILLKKKVTSNIFKRDSGMIEIFKYKTTFEQLVELTTEYGRKPNRYFIGRHREPRLKIMYSDRKFFLI